MRLARFVVMIALLLAASTAHPQESSVKELWDLYAGKQYQEALEQATGRVDAGEIDRELVHLVGRCLFDLGRDEEARPYLEQSAAGEQRDWIYAWSRLYLGAIDLRTGNDEAAVRAWTEVRDGGWTRNVSRAAENNLRAFALDEVFADWPRRQTAHCRFAFSPAYADSNLDAFAREHELAYTELTEFFGREPAMPLRYIVWDSVEQAREFCGIRSLGFANPQYCTVNCTWDQTVGHEMTHVVSFQAIEPVARARFINEGLAVCFDLSSRDRMEVAKRAVREAGLTSLYLPDLWQDVPAQRPDSVETVYYPVAGAWVWTLLDRGGRERLLELCREQTLEGARRIYGENLEQWMSEFSTDLLSEP